MKKILFGLMLICAAAVSALSRQDIQLIKTIKNGASFTSTMHQLRAYDGCVDGKGMYGALCAALQNEMSTIIKGKIDLKTIQTLIIFGGANPAAIVAILDKNSPSKDEQDFRQFLLTCRTIHVEMKATCIDEICCGNQREIRPLDLLNLRDNIETYSLPEFYNQFSPHHYRICGKRFNPSTVAFGVMTSAIGYVAFVYQNMG